MLKALEKFTIRLIEGANIATIFVMFIVGFSDYLNPASHPYWGLLGLSFPIFLIINFFFLIFWFVFHPKGAIIPILGYLVCIVPLRQYFPVNIPHKAPSGAIKLLSYNVEAFCTDTSRVDGENRILTYIRNSDADIICIQECIMDIMKKSEVDRMLSAYQYNDTVCFAHTATANNSIGVYSRYPILSKERISMLSKDNGAAAFRLKIDGDTVLLINCHLESYHLNMGDRRAYKNMIKTMEADTVHAHSRKLIDKMGDAVKIRCHQADAVAEYIRENKGRSIILCGDFNDNPISYTHRVISRDLNDCYVRSGIGPGLSYNEKGFNVRIDNILCSDDWKSYGCTVDHKFGVSDHYPIYCWLKKR